MRIVVSRQRYSDRLSGHAFSDILRTVTHCSQYRDAGRGPRDGCRLSLRMW
jgi:hypothetical protein